nr:MAG TPA: hypothetical protein [Caudoviricetes sp.]DAM04734.1 MAG TPA: hypothetical protein [Caudoviricetes sp.]
MRAAECMVDVGREENSKTTKAPARNAAKANLTGTFVF